MLLQGRFIRIRTDLTPAEKRDRPGDNLVPFAGPKEAYAGRIGIICRHDLSDETVQVVFSDTDDGSGLSWWWKQAWITVLGDNDDTAISKYDAKFIADLRAVFKRRHPHIRVVGDDDDDTAAAKQAAIAKIKTTLGQIRGHLTDLDRIVADLK